MVPVNDGDSISIFYNPNMTSVSGITGSGVFAVYKDSLDFLDLSTTNALVFQIQSLAWAGSGDAKKYTFNSDGLPLVTGNYISFSIPGTLPLNYLESSSDNPFGSQFIGSQYKYTPISNDTNSSFTIWNITSTTQSSTGVFQGELNTSKKITDARTFVTPIGETIYYGQNYYIQSSGNAFLSQKLYFWNHQNNTGVGLNTSNNSIMQVVFLDPSGNIPTVSTPPVVPPAPPPGPIFPNPLDKLNRKTVLWLLIGAVALIIIFIIGIILLIIIVKMLTKKK